jgi:hypothetical protein
MGKDLSAGERRAHILYFAAVVVGGFVLNVVVLALIAR